MNKYVKKEIQFGSKTLVIETGKIARQATSVVATMGGTVVLCSIVTKKAAEKKGFFSSKCSLS